ncbi:uncharacterized protein BO87DRAFT_402436 [Aspergillus neoniger CBS 115656]|uniref:Uncharacterized protein n=1 Tax=Aspergillus neoniger (strain CBS 115656) TaxID=1448310 RepID=A0A318Y7D5_ASPNB|nr:hypothetical protein BO87DRAFT_402436 [Aspergillus neoniger CBS 115656]PYH28223.1 hypothetical protein BO87DRAFT_402436 [Aspergillus neoniger CBS 115656]
MGWSIALVSRSETAQTSAEAKVIYRTANASNVDSLTLALDWSHVSDLRPQMLEADLQLSAPLFLVTGSILNKEPQIIFSSPCAAKAASSCIADLDTGGYTKGYYSNTIVETVFKPFFEDREKLQDGLDNWTVE